MALSKDPLLSAARAAILVIRILIVVGMIGIVIIGTVVIVAPGAIGVEADAGASRSPVIIGMLAMLMLATGALGLSYDFVGRLAAIIDTVRDGDPFTPANAARLTRMGWVALTVQLLAIPITLIGAWLQPRVDSNHLRMDTDFSLSGLILALVLFILARVFRQGTAMREDLEGTV